MSPETMPEFFDRRAPTYDEHMRESVTSFDEFYSQVAASIARTQSTLKILNIGCGTGIELDGIFDRAPNASITGIDLSDKMLGLLRIKYATRLNQINLVRDSYLTAYLGEGKYDYVVAIMTVHHLLPDSRLALYCRIKDALKRSGRYIEAEYVVSSEKEEVLLKRFEEACRLDSSITDGSHHIDMPFSLERTAKLLAEAGFADILLTWQEGEAAVHVASF